MASKVDLGDKVRDKITGLEGILVARTEYLNGCWRIGIQPQEIKDGKPVEPYWIDVEQAERVPAKPAMKGKPSGGPGIQPAERTTPPAR